VRFVLSLMPSCRHTTVPYAWIFIDPSLHAVIRSGTPRRMLAPSSLDDHLGETASRRLAPGAAETRWCAAVATGSRTTSPHAAA